jgi:putative endonuclease
MLTDRQKLGVWGEDLACNFLKKHGYRIIKRNYQVRQGEIDIIAQEKDDELIFVEVKTRTSNQFGFPEESVGYKKQVRMFRTINVYFQNFQELPYYRVDIISIEVNLQKKNLKIRHYKNAVIDYGN